MLLPRAKLDARLAYPFADSGFGFQPSGNPWFVSWPFKAVFRLQMDETRTRNLGSTLKRTRGEPGIPPAPSDGPDPIPGPRRRSSMDERRTRSAADDHRLTAHRLPRPAGFGFRPSGNPGFGFRPSGNPGFVSRPFRAVFRLQMDEARTRNLGSTLKRTRGEPGIPPAPPNGPDPNPGSRWRLSMDGARTRNQDGGPRRTKHAPGIPPTPPDGPEANPESPGGAQPRNA